MTYANAIERSNLISGLRALADFLEGRPEAPTPRWADVMVFPSSSTNEKNREEVDDIALRIGAAIEDRIADGGHYTASLSFGPVTYHAVAIDLKEEVER